MVAEVAVVVAVIVAVVVAVVVGCYFAYVVIIGSLAC